MSIIVSISVRRHFLLLLLEFPWVRVLTSATSSKMDDSIIHQENYCTGNWGVQLPSRVHVISFSLNQEHLIHLLRTLIFICAHLFSLSVSTFLTAGGSNKKLPMRHTKSQAAEKMKEMKRDSLKQSVFLSYHRLRRSSLANWGKVRHSVYSSINEPTLERRRVNWWKETTDHTLCHINVSRITCPSSLFSNLMPSLSVLCLCESLSLSYFLLKDQ